MNINPTNIVSNLQKLGYKAKFVSGTNKETGAPYNLIDITTGMRVDATLKLGENTAEFQCWGRFPEGHRGLADDALKAHNNKMAAMTRAKLEGPVMAAYVAELTGVDIALLDKGFRLSGRQLVSKRDDEPENAATGGDGVPAAPRASTAAQGFKR